MDRKHISNEGTGKSDMFRLLTGQLQEALFPISSHHSHRHTMLLNMSVILLPVVSSYNYDNDHHFYVKFFKMTIFSYYIYIHIYIYTYIHTYIHTYIVFLLLTDTLRWFRAQYYG